MSKPTELKRANPQICVCFDVYQQEIQAQLHAGVMDVDAISDYTYAGQGCGGCRTKIEQLVVDFKTQHDSSHSL